MSWAACAVLAGGVVAGCGDDDDDGGGGGGGGSTSDVETGVGVTDDTIKLGLITDLSGVFAPLATPLVNAKQAYWKQANADGGVCGRKVELVIRDNGYDVQKAVTQYRGIVGEVAAFQELLGSPMTAALTPNLAKDNTFALLVSWSSALLGNENLVITGSTYDIDMMNGLSYLMDEGKLKEGDKIGAIFFEGEYGENGLLGAEVFAEENGMELVEQKIVPTDEDMTGQVTAFKREGVAAIVMVTSPTQYASTAGVAAGQGLNVPIIGNSPTYDPALLATEAAEAIKANGYVVGPTVGYSSDAPGAKAARTAFEKEYDKADAKFAVPFGWAQADQMYKILEAACEAGDLTRDGLIAAVQEVQGTDLDGIMSGELDYSDISQPPSRATYVFRPDDAPGGLTEVGPPIESELAANYDPSAG